MSFVSNVYIIKTLSTAKALTLQEGHVYRDISEMDICNDTYFTACFGEGAYACMDELQDIEALADATARFYELVNVHADATVCELKNNVIVIKRGYLKQYFDNKIAGLKNIIDKATGKDYLKVKYQIKDYLESIDEHVYPTQDSKGHFIQSVDSWLENCLEADKDTYIQIVGQFSVRG